MANAAKKITEAELLEVQSMNNAFNQLKLKIADTVLTKEHLLGEVAKLKEEYKSVEEKLTEKYGQDAVIDNGPCRIIIKNDITYSFSI